MTLKVANCAAGGRADHPIDWQAQAQKIVEAGLHPANVFAARSRPYLYRHQSAAQTARAATAGNMPAARPAAGTGTAAGVAFAQLTHPARLEQAAPALAAFAAPAAAQLVGLTL
jgi:hypothetical protein